MRIQIGEAMEPQELPDGSHSKLDWARLLIVAVLAIILTIGSIVLIPPLVYRPLGKSDLEGVTSQRERRELVDARLRLQNDFRTTLLQAVAGLIALTAAVSGAYITWRQLGVNRRQLLYNQEISQEQLKLSRDQLAQAIESGQEQLRLSREGQLTERFTRAVEQLGSDKLDVRLGGIYSLERIAHDSPGDRPTIAEVLTAYLRSHAPWPPMQIGQPSQDTAPEDVAPLRERAPDVQAVLWILGRGLFSVGGYPTLDLSSVDLRHADLTGARLSGTRFDRAVLTQSSLDHAQLSGARFDHADLCWAWLGGAELSDARLDSANLTEARLDRAILRRARLDRAQLTRATLDGAHLSAAWLDKADLESAHIQDADLRKASLREVNLKQGHLDRSDLSCADLFRSNFRRATLDSAVLSTARFNGVDFTGAHADSQTSWPEGFDPRGAGIRLSDHWLMEDEEDQDDAALNRPQRGVADGYVALHNDIFDSGWLRWLPHSALFAHMAVCDLDRLDLVGDLDSGPAGDRLQKLLARFGGLDGPIFEPLDEELPPEDLEEDQQTREDDHLLLERICRRFNVEPPNNMRQLIELLRILGLLVRTVDPNGEVRWKAPHHLPLPSDRIPLTSAEHATEDAAAWEDLHEPTANAIIKYFHDEGTPDSINISLQSLGDALCRDPEHVRQAILVLLKHEFSIRPEGFPIPLDRLTEEARFDLRVDWERFSRERFTVEFATPETAGEQDSSESY